MPNERMEILEKLRAFFEKIDLRAGAVSPEEDEEIINEALRSTRPGYRPVDSGK